MTASTQAALSHLRNIKPNDGWSVENQAGKGFRLLRRNVPLTDVHFQDVHYCPEKKVVVGILRENGASCQVLVDETGRPVSEIRTVSVTTYHKRPPATRTSFTTPPPTAANNRVNALSPQETQRLLQYGLGLLAALIVLKILLRTDLTLLFILLLPIVYIYACQTCPPMNSFDAKKELKRVMRGHHLPDQHPNKPKGWFEEMAARVTASVATEMVTMPGYELEFKDLAGAGWIAEVRVPAARLQCFWVGAFGRWFYVTSFEPNPEN